MGHTDDEINLIDLWNVLVKRRNIIIVLFALSTFTGLGISLTMPKIYEGEAVVALPVAGTSQTSDRIGNSARSVLLVNASETRAIMDTLIKEIKRRNPIAGLDEKLLNKIAAIKLEQIKGSESQVKLIAQVKEEPKAAIEVIDKIIHYLQENDSTKQKISIEKTAIEASLAELNKTIERAEKTRNEAIKLMEVRNPVGFNPVDLDVKISEMKIKAISLESSLSITDNYKFVIMPHSYWKPIKPRVALNTLVAGIAGLCIGLLMVFILESFAKNRNEN